MKYPFAAVSVVSAFTASVGMAAVNPNNTAKEKPVLPVVQYVCNNPTKMGFMMSFGFVSWDGKTAQSFEFKVSPDNPKLAIPIGKKQHHICPKAHETLAR